MATVVLLPGMDGSGLLFDDFVAAMDCRSIVVAYPPDQAMGYRELEEYVRLRLPVDEPFVLLAESFSGPLAITLAASRPSQLKALVLVCTFARLPVPSFLLWLLRPAALFPLWRVPTSFAAKMLLGRFRCPAKECLLNRAMGAVMPSVWRARIKAVLSADETSSLSRISVPVLYLRATEDRMVFSSASAVVSAHVPKCNVAAIEGPHLLLQSKPKESAAAVRTFAAEYDFEL